MTRTAANPGTQTHTLATILRERGPLTTAQCLRITGWKRRAVSWSIERLVAADIIVAERQSTRRYVYRAAA
jgi:predicted transcriptional regulator